MTITTSPGHAVSAPPPRMRLPLLDDYLREQQELTAVERFARRHDASGEDGRYRELLPARPPGPGQQYAFEVDLDACTSCKACVTACHNLNGLDDGETWRSVGLLHGGSASAAVLQSVTTACHHCLDPACMTGCPVGAYTKHPVTGIVEHLDDQCIGCQYCTFTCPYEVPQYNAQRGIVRKCDMCSGRLAGGEAPACVQACPNEAIAITVIETRQALEDAQGDAFLPGTPSPGITIPTTVYKTERALPRNLLPADFYRVAPSHHHAPLVVMLVLTQLSVGAFVIDAIASRALPAHALATQQPVHSIVALAVGLVALAASVFHLGRPRYAFRAVLGLRTSWMSREIVAFGLFAAAAVAYAAASFSGARPEGGMHEALRWTVATLGVVGIACSVAIYHATRRAWWTASITGFKFFLTAAVLGLATTIVTSSAYRDRSGVAATLSCAVALVSMLKAAGEATLFLHLGDKRHTALKRSALLAANDLRGWSVARFAALALGGIALPLANAQRGSLGLAIASLVVLAVGELAERTLFFAASSSPGMPGAVR
jgi:Fe-S-cluster-containing dehydrogenase component/DMSO reductase anchor subunit